MRTLPMIATRRGLVPTNIGLSCTYRKPKRRLWTYLPAYNHWMTRFSPLRSLALAFLGLTACGRAPSPPHSPAANAVAPPENLNRLVERYWDERAPAGVSIAPQFLADSLSLERRFLAEVLAVPRATLDADAALTYDIFKSQREFAIEGFTYPSELLPVNPFDSMPLE